MADREHTFQPPWTPGPWKQDLRPYHQWIVDGNGHPVAETQHGEENGDAALIALAPEMAETILAWKVWQDGGPAPTTEAMHKVADKLRAIGNTDA